VGCNAAAVYKVLSRLLDDPRTPVGVCLQAGSIYPTLDLVRLLQDIRACQRKLVEIADTPVAAEAGSISAPTIDQFLMSLKTAWREGQANPTARAKPKVPRLRRHLTRWRQSISKSKAGLLPNPGEHLASSLIACMPNFSCSIMKGTFACCRDSLKI
jgi:hypothetical protein